MDSASEVVHGFPHLRTVQSALTALYRRITADTLHADFAVSVPPADVALDADEDLHLGVQRVARTLVQHLRLPDARMIVSFREMPEAAVVELAEGPEYFVELNPRFREYRRDIGGALAHEVMHVCLDGLGLSFPDTAENEILTDTATAYLGAGWLLLDAFREGGGASQRFGYLTPEEFGYVVAKRALAFGENPEIWFTSPQAYEAYNAGMDMARRDARRPPLAASGRLGRHRYTRDRRRAQEMFAQAGGGGLTTTAAPVDGYAFEDGSPLRVSFPCPVCHQRIRVPVRGHVRARCGLCKTVLECDT
ncbi:hypothetical protein [Streptomyces phytophilus]|uniref:hypothetical protein n=1 Tax=Streptomyces phytophilus TaxID=722715 RepID=UPI0015F0A893|nr:hypothetical protein [Streptomyces phytophilus]